jgi:hypothetical protein
MSSSSLRAAVVGARSERQRLFPEHVEQQPEGGQQRGRVHLADLGGSTLDASGTVTLTNVSDTPASLHMSVQQGDPSDDRAEATPAAARLAPGGQVTVRLRVHGPQPADGTDLSGYLRAAVDGAPTVTVPYLLAVRLLDLHASPDPAATGSTVFVHAEPALAAPPTARISPPTGPDLTVTATFDHTGWWRVTVPAGPPSRWPPRRGPDVCTGCRRSLRTRGSSAPTTVAPAGMSCAACPSLTASTWRSPPIRPNPTPSTSP